MNYLDHMMKGITSDGNRFKRAWLMGLASYHYTASFIGNTNPPDEPVFTQWDAIKGGFECAWDTLWRNDE